MFLSEEAGKFDLPVHETGFTSKELEELLSFLESDEPISPKSGSEGSTCFDLPVHETGFTSKELEELLSFLESDEPISPKSGSEGSTWALPFFESNEPGSPHYGSEGSTRAVYTTDERKKRRMVSNRESARRSRWRKRMHLENITDEVNRLSIENQELKNRLSLVMDQYHIVWLENEQLRSESVALWGKLLDLYWTLATMQPR